MAFITTQLPLQRGFEQALQVAGQEKDILNNWKNQLSGNITGLDAMNMLANLNRVLTVFSQISALPGLAVYVQQQFGNANYDVAAEFTSMVAALTSIQSWLKANIPANAVSISEGALVGATYTPAQTSVLLTRVNAAISTIS